mmetsp:Transcript_26415/g.40324  ORF Transcript_26415/g.40324 Transcript_26415/m.40324 type:complete len:307 (-) Transcript_26415:432-1352(-)
MLADKYQVLKDLGSGATAEVKLVQEIQTQKQFACKIMKTDKAGNIPKQVLADVQKEVAIMSGMSHTNIINVSAVGQGPYAQEGKKTDDALFIVMENAQEGELFDMISNTGKFSESTARYFFIQLLSALNYMQNTVGVCHRDLKPENILLDKDFNLKIADFGFAIPLVGHTGNCKLNSYKGTLGYMPPEQLAKKAYSGKAADLFSAAVVLFMMVTQCQPFEEARVTDKYYKFLAGNKPEVYWSIFDKVTPMSEDLKDLLTGMLQLDPAARFTLEEIFAHPWVQDAVPTHKDIQKEFGVRKQTNDLAR